MHSLQSVRQARHQAVAELPSPRPLCDGMNILVKESAGLFIYTSTMSKFVEDEHSTPHGQLELVPKQSAGSSLPN